MFSKITKKEILVILSFMTGYIFALSANDSNLMIIISSLSWLSIAISNIVYLFFVFLIYKVLIKKYKYFIIKEFNKKEITISIMKNIFLGYFLGIITLMGNVFIKVIM